MPCRVRVATEGKTCKHHSGAPKSRRMTDKELLRKLELADLACGNDQHETKLILEGVIQHLKGRT